jgi:hypothetical protein
MRARIESEIIDDLTATPIGRRASNPARDRAKLVVGYAPQEIETQGRLAL